jgi:hypothetical protein
MFGSAPDDVGQSQAIRTQANDPETTRRPSIPALTRAAAVLGRLPARRLLGAGLVLIIAVCGSLFVLSGPRLPIHNDELNFLIEGMRLPSQHRLVGYVHTPLVYEIMAAIEVIWFCVAKLLGHVHTPVEHLAQVLADTGPHLVAGRIVTLLAAILCLVQVYRLGSLFAGPVCGALASLLCATNLTFFVAATSIKDDVYCWLFLVTAMNVMGRLGPDDLRRALGAGFAVGASFAAKYFGIFGILLAIVPALKQDGRGRAQVLRQVTAFGIGAAAGVLVLFPFLITDLSNVLHSMQRMAEATTHGMGPELGLRSYFTVHLPRLLGPLVGISAIAEFVVLIRRQPRGPITLALPIMGLMGFLVLRRGLTMAYYAFPIAILGFVLSAGFAVRAAHWARARFSALPPLGLALVAIFDPTYLSSTLKYGLLLVGPDTRLMAADKVASLVPSGSCVVLNGALVGWNVFGPALAPAEASITSATGAFALAERAAIALRPPPHYRLRLQEGFSAPKQIEDDCGTLVLAHLGALSTLELGPQPPTATEPPASLNLVRIAEIQAFPQVHTTTYPLMSFMDIDELRRISLGDLWRNRRYGPSYVIYQRVRSRVD